MEILINKFANKYICFYSLCKVKGAWNKGQLLKEKRGGEKVKNHYVGICWIAEWLGSECKLSIKNASVALQRVSPKNKISKDFKMCSKLIWVFGNIYLWKYLSIHF